MNANLTQEQILSRGVVQKIKDNRGMLMIVTADGTEFRFTPDEKLCHDIALAAQDHFRRTGRDYRRAGR